MQQQILLLAAVASKMNLGQAWRQEGSIEIEQAMHKQNVLRV